MDAPLCKICGARHWGAGHVGMSKPQAKVIAGKAIERTKASGRANRPAKDAPFDKKAYQRELMRKRRAEKKVSK